VFLNFIIMQSYKIMPILQSALKTFKQLYSFFIRIFDCVLDTHARQSPNKFGFALDLFVSLHKFDQSESS